MGEMDGHERGDEQNDNHDEETEIGGRDNPGYDPDDYETEGGRKKAAEAVAYLRTNGFKTPSSLRYSVVEGNYLVSQEGKYWFEVAIDGRGDTNLVPYGHNRFKPWASLYDQLGIDLDGRDTAELIHIGGDETDPLISREKAREESERFLKQVFKDPKLKQIFHDKDEYDNTWVSLMQTNATKYVVNEDGTLFRAGGKRGKPSETLLKLLGRTKLRYLTKQEALLRTEDTRVEELRKKLTRFHRDIREQRDQIGRLEQRNQDLTSDMKRKDKQVADLNKRLGKETSPEERKQLESELKSLKAALASDNVTIKTNDERIKDLRAQIEQEPNNKELQQEIDRLEAENERVRADSRDFFEHVIKGKGQIYL